MIREMKTADLDEVLVIEREQFPEGPWPRDAYIYELEENPFSFLYVDETEGRITGYADLWITFEQAQIANIAVHPGSARQGIASRLMDHCIRKAEESGCEVLTLEVRVTNSAALGLYEKYGLIRAAVRRQYYENGDDAWLMVKPLGGTADDNDTGD